MSFGIEVINIFRNITINPKKDYPLIVSTRSQYSTTFQNLFVRNVTLENSVFYRQNPLQGPQNPLQMIQASFKLINSIFQDLKQINYKISDPPRNTGLFMHIEGPTNFFIDNITVNNSILYSKNKNEFQYFLII